MFRLIFACALIASSFGAHALDAVTEERIYRQYTARALSDDKAWLVAWSPMEAKLMVDALWDIQEEGPVPPHFNEVLERLAEEQLPLSERLRVAVLRHRQGLPAPVPADLAGELLAALSDRSEGEAIAYHILGHRADLRRMGLQHVVTAAARQHPRVHKEVLSAERPVGDQSALARDLWNHTPALSTWRGGSFAEGVRLYMFCRTNRLHPCLMVLRDRRHDPVRLRNGKLWSQPALASSANDIPSSQRNGNTPAGILTMESVMPEADEQVSFGKFRRVILDFVPKSRGEALQKAILPASSRNDDWWRPGVVARNIGRNLLRIHGTGKINPAPEAPWFPFMRTSGCVAKRENTYDGKEYKDQRELLDTLMEALALTPAYENETAIRGVFFIMDINDDAKPVTLADLAAAGIE